MLVDYVKNIDQVGFFFLSTTTQLDQLTSNVAPADYLMIPNQIG